MHNNWTEFFDTLNSVKSNINWNTSIETEIPNTQGKKYVTIIRPNGSVTNYFPSDMSNIDSEYWRVHNSKVDEALESRNYLLFKIVQLWEQYSKLNSNMVSSIHVDMANKGNPLMRFFWNLSHKFRLFFKI